MLRETTNTRNRYESRDCVLIAEIALINEKGTNSSLVGSLGSQKGTYTLALASFVPSRSLIKLRII